jgi:fucose 4-O-acetylase-like acetyltransferase
VNTVRASEAARQGAPLEASSQRNQAIDVLRGFGIVGVVVGHAFSGAPTTPIFWVHMPLFFAVSGSLYRPVARWPGLRSWVARRAHALLVPYAAFLVLTALATALAGRHGAIWQAWVPPASVTGSTPAINPWLSLLLGGRAIGGTFVIYWFTTCLFATQVLFAAMLLAVRSRVVCAGLVLVAYALAHVESSLFPGPRLPVVPWALDTALMAFPFYALGFVGRRMLSLECRGARVLSAVAVAAAVGLTVCRLIGVFHYKLDLRALEYRHPALDLVVPVLFILALAWLSRLVVRTPLKGVFTLLGTTTMPIMYLHIPLAKAMFAVVRVPRVTLAHLFLLAVICLFAPAGLARLLFPRFRLLRLGLLGARS